MTSETTSGEITHLLVRWNEGDSDALEPLIQSVYQELQKLASAYLRRERSDHTFQTSALVHEAYLRLIDQKRVKWRNRSHFFGIAAQIMRRILIDHARGQLYAKRGGGVQPLSLDEALTVSLDRSPELVALDDALNDLARIDDQQAKIVEMRFFGGLTKEEIGEVQGISSRTVIRGWRMARAWLFRALEQGESVES